MYWKSSRTLISESHDWLFWVWSMRALTADGPKSLNFSIDKHMLWGEKFYLLDCRQHLRLPGNGTVILPLWDKNRLPLSSFLPAIFCHVKRLINSPRWWHHYWNYCFPFFGGGRVCYFCSCRLKQADAWTFLPHQKIKWKEFVDWQANSCSPS